MEERTGHRRMQRFVRLSLLTAVSTYLLIVLGGVLLLVNLGFGGVDWDVVWRLWPAILIYAGLVRILRYVSF